MKDRAKTFMFLSIGIMALAIAFQMGANSVKAQAGGNIAHVVSEGSGPHCAITETGDVYYTNDITDMAQYPWMYYGNLLEGSVSASQKSIGDVKSLYGR